MNIVIIGCGRFGSVLAKDLSGRDHNISVVDNDSERLGSLGTGFNGLIIKGVEYDDEVLQEAGISNADALLALTSDENINITVSLIAKKIYKVPRIIARTVNPDRQYIYEKLNIETINPINLGVDILKSKLSVNKSDIIVEIDREYEVAEITVTKNRHWTVKDLENKYTCVISAILKENNFIFPEKTDIINPGEKIICTVGKQYIEQLISAL